MSSLRWLGWSVRLASPPILIPLFALVWGLGYWLSAGAERLPAPAALTELPLAGPARTLEAAYLVVDALGLERPGFAEVTALPAANDESTRLSASLSALRDDLVAAGVWPAALPAARAVVIEVDRRRLALIDVPELPPGMRASIADELVVVRSLVATAERTAAADEVRITVAGAERDSLWGAVALRR